jgi:hypothetical protein
MQRGRKSRKGAMRMRCRRSGGGGGKKLGCGWEVEEEL